MFALPDYGLRSVKAIRLCHVSAEPATTRIRAIPSTRRYLWTLGRSAGQRLGIAVSGCSLDPFAPDRPECSVPLTRPTRKTGARLTNVCRRAPSRHGARLRRRDQSRIGTFDTSACRKQERARAHGGRCRGAQPGEWRSQKKIPAEATRTVAAE